MEYPKFLIDITKLLKNITKTDLKLKLPKNVFKLNDLVNIYKIWKIKAKF